MLVACFMLVIILMQEAKQPDNWRWMWAFQGNESQPDGQPNEDDVDTRLRPPPEVRDEQLEAEQVVIQGSQTDSVDDTPDTEDRRPTAGVDELTPVQRARQDAWSQFVGAMTEENRTHFLRGLKSERDGADLSEEDAEAWPSIVDQFNVRWQDYLDKAFLTVSQDDGRLTDDEKQNWLEVVEKLRDEWVVQVEPALRAVGDGVPRDAERREIVADLQSTLDTVFLLEIRDNTVFRPVEKDAWFRMLEEMQRRDLADIELESTGPAGFLQLYRQPDEYRGRLVTVRGAVRRGHHVQAPDNFYGIDSYYIFWLKPTGANSPIAVYCLDVPDGFPEVVEMERRGETSDLDEDVEFTGFFFKRRAYRAMDGTRLTPVVLAKIPRWQPAVESSPQPATLPGPLFWTLMLSGTCILGIGVACVIYWMSRRSSPQVVPRMSRTAAVSQNEAEIPQEVTGD